MSALSNMSIQPPPAPEEPVSVIRSSCKALTDASNITINDEAIDVFLAELDQSEWQQFVQGSKHGLRLPLRFDSQEEELNVLSIIALLNFLSGYRQALHRLTSRGAYSLILSLVLSAHLSSTSTNSYLSTQGFLAATPEILANLAQIETHTEKDHPTLGPAVRVGEKDEEAFEVLELLVKVLKETGQILQSQGKKNLGEWVKQILIETEGDSNKILKLLVETFPAFNDAYTFNDKPVYIYKKALYLLTAIAQRFSSTADEFPPSFPLPTETENFPIFADNVIPTLLLHFKILDCSICSDSQLVSLNSNSPDFRLSSTSATRLRAAAVTACARIVSRAQTLSQEDSTRGWLKTMTESDLDGWIWNLGKKGELRELPRIEERNTMFY